MKPANFIGRKEELKQLNLLLDKRSASLVVVREEGESAKAASLRNSQKIIDSFAFQEYLRRVK